MWRVLRGEFDYTKDWVIRAYFIAVFFLVIAASMESWSVHSYMWITTIIYFSLMGLAGNDAIAEKRYRLFATLPVTPNQLAAVDGLYVTVIQLGMALLWIVLLIFKPESRTEGMLWLMIANIATTLSLIMIYSIHYHLGFFGAKNYRRLNYAILLALILLAGGLIYFGKLEPVGEFLKRHYPSPVGALASIALCIGLTWLSAALFVRRKSYLS